jgi:hypothetical protein
MMNPPVPTSISLVIEEKRKVMNDLAALHQDLQHPAVLMASKELDELIVLQMKASN